MRVQVVHSVNELARDCEDISGRPARDLPKVVRRNVIAGNRIARSNAQATAPTHGKFYPDAFSWEMTGPLQGEYGPDPNDPRGQGGMSFEDGSRNQPPHNDIANSRDIIVPRYHADVHDTVGGWFWP